MFNYRIAAIIKRELKEKLFSKTFILMTVLIPVLMFGIIGVQAFIATYEGDQDTTIEFITDSIEMESAFQQEFQNLEFIKNGYYKVTYNTMNREQFNEYLDAKKPDLLSEKLNGIIYVSDTAMENKEIEFYSKTPKNITVSEKLSGTINKILVANYFADKQLSSDEISYIRKGVDFKSYKISEEEEIKEEGYGNMVLSYLFTFLLYISLLMMGQMVMQSVMEEKQNRIVEILLSSVNSRELMTGKIVGSSITGVLQMAIWLSPIMVVISTAWLSLPEELLFNISFNQILFLLFNYFLGLVIFLGLFATVGAIFENPQEAQSGMWPVMLLIMIPFFIALSLMKNPSNPMAEISSMFPFASIIVMPARFTLVDVPVWQFIVAFIVNVGTIFAIFPIAGKIYRVGLLRTGKKPKWSEVVKWIKYKY
ncbi:MAG: ABC transporter permease [Melioribacteraceae bacterium]|nr:ABC transporter permease [Melioribacteraceae bacterium]MCF8354771.1 ABC transporter permease [Melioribacteraceae bacterium]MCF8394396.1 ABC transporter permease [Melioribacteraceae bacterium]MCF8417508.1 ABC transporter permease [Melioribacteraceae bacterium]